MAFETGIERYFEYALIRHEERGRGPLEAYPAMKLQGALAESCSKDALQVKRRATVLGGQLSEALDLAVDLSQPG